MKIAFVSMIREAWGGSEELWAAAAEIALEKGYQVVHLGFEVKKEAPKMLALQSKGMKLLKRPGYIPQDSGSFIQFLFKTRNFLRKKISPPFKELLKQKPELIIYNGTSYSITYEKELMNLIEGSQIPFFIVGQLLDERKEPSPEEKKEILHAYRLAKKVFFVSERSLITARKHLNHSIPNGEVVRNPVNLSSSVLLPYPSIDGFVNLGCVANLVIEHKAQDVLFHALSRCKFQNWQLNLYGEGKDRLMLESLARQLGLNTKIIFHGRVSDIKEVWKKNHLLVLTSHMEGMPLAVVEAMLCGRPCLVSDIGGNSEWIIDNETGFILPKVEISPLSLKLDQAFARRESWKEMGEKAQQRALILHDPNAGASFLNRIIAP